MEPPSAGDMARQGEDDGDPIIATAQHIVQSLHGIEHSTQDVLHILSTFDDRLAVVNRGLKMPKSHTNHRQRHLRERKEASAPLPPNPDEQNDVLCQSLQMAGDTVLKWEVASSESSSESSRKTRIWEGKESSSAYLTAVDELQDLMGSLSTGRRDRSTFDHAQSLLQLAMERLEDEFRHILVAHSNAIESDWTLELIARGTEDNSPDTASRSSAEDEDEDDIDPSPLRSPKFIVDLLPAEVVLDLNDLARRMMAGGYGRECCQIYSSFRKAVLEQNIHRLGVEKLSVEDVHKMAWENLEVRIKKWVQTLKASVRVLYASERVLCDRVFDGLNPWKETAFLELSKGSMIQLLSLGESIAISRRSPEKLFRILDMYETLWELLPDISAAFYGDLCAVIRSEANGILVRLGEAARGTFAEFENAIQRDASKIPVPGAAVHPLTRYVMNYIWFLFCYTGTLKRLLGDKKLAAPRINGGGDSSWDCTTSDEENCTSASDHLSPLAVQIIWLTVLLECNLDGKSKLYRDVAQSYLFLMNNAHYIVQKVKQSELASLIGEDWIRKQSCQVWQYATNFVRAGWSKVLGCLRDEGLTTSSPFSSGVSKAAVKERIKAFNSAFEEVYKTQSTWVVPDLQLREMVRLSIAEKLIPAYDSFISRYQIYLESGRHPGKYVKFSSEDLNNCLLHLFEGAGVSGQAVRKSFSLS